MTRFLRTFGVVTAVLAMLAAIPIPLTSCRLQIGHILGNSADVHRWTRERGGVAGPARRAEKVLDVVTVRRKIIADTLELAGHVEYRINGQNGRVVSGAGRIRRCSLFPVGTGGAA